MNTLVKEIQAVSMKFSNGVTVVNATPHPLNFQSPEGEKVVVPTSVPEGEKTGPVVINAKAVETPAGAFLVKTVFEPTPEGTEILAAIDQVFGDTPNVMVVGSIIAMNAFAGRVRGLVPAPGFERVPPAEKLMSVEKFNTAL